MTVAGGLHVCACVRTRAAQDDKKVRACWRELYNDEEVARLRAQVRLCASNGIEFMYAVAPGLDIVHSRPSDVAALTGKLQQVRAELRFPGAFFWGVPHLMTTPGAQICSAAAVQMARLGVTAFAVLFDDIPEALCEQDACAFASQVCDVRWCGSSRPFPLALDRALKKALWLRTTCTLG